MFFCCYFFLSFWIIVKLLFLLLGLIGLKWGDFYVVWGEVRRRSEEIAIAEGYGFRGRRHSLGVVWGLAGFLIKRSIAGVYSQKMEKTTPPLDQRC